MFQNKFLNGPNSRIDDDFFFFTIFFLFFELIFSAFATSFLRI